MILALNCGSSSVKFACFDDALACVEKGMIETPGQDGIAQVLALIRSKAFRLRAAGHRVVHGGETFSEPVVITQDVRDDIERLAPLAPEHQLHHIAGINAVSAAFPELPQIACFDTAFHRTIPRHRQEMALPKLFADEGVLRYGFHGLSYQYVASVVSAPKMIVCHLGNGCSLAAIEQGQSIYTSMGFTPLDGLMMGSRSGGVDPGAVLWLVDKMGSTETVRTLLNKASGLKGVSGLSSDMRKLLESDSPRAQFAVEMFVDRLVLEIGKAAGALQGVDALVFTGGIGENAALIRSAALSQIGWLGFAIDERLNSEHAHVITTRGSQATAYVVGTEEELMIARSVQALMPRVELSG